MNKKNASYRELLKEDRISETLFTQEKLAIINNNQKMKFCRELGGDITSERELNSYLDFLLNNVSLS